jgi:hypothetical protein
MIILIDNIDNTINTMGVFGLTSEMTDGGGRRKDFDQQPMVEAPKERHSEKPSTEAL